MATLRDLAAASGVSIRTVNRVLKSAGYVHARTRERVGAAVRKLGYKPNLAARSLKTARSHLIAVLTFSADELRMAQVAALEHRLRQADYLVSMSFQLETRHPAKTLGVVAEILRQNPAGIVVLGHDPFVGEKLIPLVAPALVRARVPYVLLDPKAFDAPLHKFDSVLIDRGHGVREAMQYLERHGRKRIAFLGTQDDRTRLNAYEDAMRQLRRPPILIHYPGDDFDEIRLLGKRFPSRVRHPDAVLAHSDYIAMAFLSGLHDSGAQVPKDVAVIGFDDRPAARLAWPALTTIAQPLNEAGRAAAEIILRKIAGERRPPSGWTQTFPTRLIVRETA
ncbi:MAG TPA: LacI family DNA-binding transcriptional regulator [Candidatus Methylacidiphilales bacterium]|jgi:LacI family transcriptional regulator|nr:LacI family DNA-binding transcriptional regulator [Candidatus Methylacidiphilales bacterium]